MLTAKTADVQELYEESVQSPGEEVEFIQRQYKRRHGRDALSMREDFCGSSAFASAWVKSDKRRTAVGVDLDAKVLAWAEKHHRSKLTPSEKKRLTLVKQDVRDPLKQKFDLVIAYNYSWWIFKERKELLRYFKTARASLKKDGMFFLDIFGGSLADQVSLEPRKYKKFTYIWEQASYNPIDGHFLAHIHFEFKDGSRVDKAFTYDWRMWRLPEVRETLIDAGFKSVDVYWEETDKDGEGTGFFRIQKTVENDPSYNTYIVAHV